MIVTLNEIEQWCLRALAGCGAPPGTDEDAAASAGWLVARGFPALELLVAALDRCGDAAAAAQLREQPQVEGVRRFDAAGRSAVFLAGALIDNAVAGAATRQAPSRLAVTNLADPLFLLPIAERYRHRGWCFVLRWGAAGARLDGKGPSLLGNASALAIADAAEVAIACGTQSLDRAPEPAVSLSAADLAARTAATLERGVTVADDTWTRLKVLGMRALVPASEESRLRGAGSAASDNE